MTRTARTVRWLVRHLPAPVLDSPERVLINVACILIGLSGMVTVQSGSVLAAWPRWMAVEWSAAMLVGGSCALFGFWTGRLSVARLGYLLIAIAAVVYAAGALAVFGTRGVYGALIWLSIAVAKVIRLAVGSATREAILQAGRDVGRT